MVQTHGAHADDLQILSGVQDLLVDGGVNAHDEYVIVGHEGSQLLPGDLVLTSGLGDYYPADLTIGSVREVKTDDSGAASYAVVEPAAELESLSQVFVVKDFTIVD